MNVLLSFEFELAGVAAIVVLISHPQQMDKLFFGPDGVLQGDAFHLVRE